MRFIDAPVDTLIRNNFNEAREYRLMNTKFLMLNSAFGATASRTNKVQLDESAVSRLSQESAWNDCRHMTDAYRICVTHQPPNREIDYVLDGYDAPMNWDWTQTKYDASKGTINNLYYLFRNAIMEVYEGKKTDSARGKFQKEYENQIDTVKQLNIVAYEKQKHYFTEDAALFMACMERESRDAVKSEEDKRLVDRIADDIQWGNSDSVKYEEIIKQSTANATVFLCGHVHEPSIGSMKIIQGTKLKERVVIGAKFLSTKPTETIPGYQFDKTNCLFLKAKNDDKAGKGIIVNISEKNE